MANPIVVVILVAAAEAHEPSTIAMTRAAREALGPEAVVVVQESDAKPKSPEAAAIVAKLHADAVASVTWTMPERRAAHVTVVLSDGRALERDLGFAPSDADGERGRAAGLAVVALIPEPAAAPASPPAASPGPKPSEAAAPPVPKRPVDAAPARTTAPRAWLGLDAFATASSGPLGVGGGLGFRWLTRLSPRVAASVRTGRLADDVTLRTVDFAIGIAPTFVDGPTRLGARVELGGTQQWVSFGGESKSRVVSHARALAETSFWATPAIGAAVAGGVELTFGETRVLAGDTTLATIPRARLVFELIVRAAL